MSNKFKDIVNNESAQADKDLAVSTAKENLARANKEARDEVALAKEIDNAETLVTDENSVIDPANAGENAQFFSMNDMSVQPVSSVEINGVSVDPNKHQKTLKSFKLRNVTNWHRKLYFIAPAISVCAIAGALTPIAIVKPIKAMEPVITIDDDSSEGISVKSNDVRLNKDSTITLNCDDQDRIKTVNAYINDYELNQDQYSFDSMSNVVSIKAEAMTSVNVKLKVITDAPRFNVTISDNPSGLKNIKHKSYASFRKEFTFECELRDNYILEQNEFNNGLELTVNGRRLTEANEVSVKQLNGNKYAITIHKGIVNGDIKLSGRVTKFNCKLNKAADTNEENYVDDVPTKQKDVSYQQFDDINDVVTLKENGIKPTANIIVDDNGREIKLVEGNDYKINSNLRGTQYHYDLVWTDNGKKKIVGPVKVELKATTGTITWNNPDVETLNNLDIAVGMPCRSNLNFGAKLQNESEIKDIRIIEGNDLGYVLDDNYQLVPVPGVVQKTGTIKLQARIDNLVKYAEVKVVEPYITITNTSHKVLVGTTTEGYSAEIKPSYLQDEYPGVIEKTDYSWKSDDENIIKTSKKGDEITVTGVTKGVTNLTATTTLTNKKTGTTYNCVGKYRIDCVKPKFEEADWETVVGAINTFYLEYYKDNASKEDKIKAMKKLCNNFDDTEYKEIDEEKITDPDKQVEAHLANFLGKQQTVVINNNPHKIRIIGINHDVILDKDSEGNPRPLNGKKALFTFDSVNVVCDVNKQPLYTFWDAFGYAPPGEVDGKVIGKNWWFCADQYAEKPEDRHLSILYKNLNSTDDNNRWYSVYGTNYNNTDNNYKKSVYSQLLDYFENTIHFGEGNCPIKQVTKHVGMRQNRQMQAYEPKINEYILEAYDAYCFPLTSREVNQDLSVISGEKKIQHGVKNEGEPYKQYVDHPEELLKQSIGDSTTHVQYLLASPMLREPIYPEEPRARENCGTSYYYNKDKKTHYVATAWMTNSVYISVAFAFCI